MSSVFGPEDFDDYDYYDELDDDFDDLGAGLPLDEDEEDRVRQKKSKSTEDRGSCSTGCCSFIFLPIIIIAVIVAFIKSCGG